MQYYGHREKLKLIGREHELEAFNRQALKMARQVANETGTLMAGNICNTTLYTPNNDEIANKCTAMFKVTKFFFELILPSAEVQNYLCNCIRARVRQ